MCQLLSGGKSNVYSFSLCFDFLDSFQVVKLFTIFPKVDFFTCRWIRAIFVLTFSPRGENVNTNMALIHRQVKKRNMPFYIKNDMGPTDSLTDGRKRYDCDEKYHIQKWQEGALFSFTLRWKIVVSLVTFRHLVNI